MKNMFKKMMMLTTMFAVLVTSGTINPIVVNAASNNVTVSGRMGDPYSVYWNQNRSWWFKNHQGLPKITANGEVAYCIEPMVAPIEAGNADEVPLPSFNSIRVFLMPEVSSSIGPRVTLSQNIKNKINLIANYGYDYPGHKTDKYRAAAQIMIWEELGFSVDRGINVTTEYNTIKKLVDTHYDRPSWNSTKQKVKKGQVVTLSGANTFSYDSSNSKGVSVKVEGNSFKVTVNNPNDAKFSVLKKVGKANGVPIVYGSGSSQMVLVGRSTDPVRAAMTFEPSNGWIELGKKDDGGKWISNTEFEVSSNKSNILGTFKTGSNGKVKTSALEPGTYYVREKFVPAPLIIDTTWKQVSVKADETTTFTATNKSAVGKIQITKFGYNELTLPEPKSASYEYIVEGAKFDVKDSSGKVVEKLTTNSKGIATSKELPLGTYTLHETFVPKPLILDKTPIEAKLEYKNQTTSVVLREVSQHNKEAVGQIKVTKKSIHGDLIQDTTFEIKDTNGQLVDTITTNSNGEAKSRDLLLGKYTITEVSVPKNLVLEKTPMTVELKYKDQTTAVVLKGTTKVNEYQRSDLKLTKVENDWDELQPEFNGIKLQGVLLELYARKDILEGSKKIYLKDELIGEAVSDKHGNVTFHNLPIGEYYVKETKAPEGYILHDGVWNISIKYDGKNPETEVTTTESTLENQIAYGRSKIHKTAKGGKEFLKDAKFGLFTKNDKKLGEFITDAKGEFISPNLRFGHYYWQEIEAPKGYFTDNTKHHFEITVEDHKSIIHLPVDNEYIEIRLQVIKKDAETDVPLKDAIFEIHDEHGEVITFDYADDNLEVHTQSQLITNEKGIAMTRGFLKYGKYLLVEVEAPKGYLRQESIEFTIDEKTEFVELPVFGKTKVQDISNQPTTVEVIKLSENTEEPLEGAHLQLINKKTNDALLDWVSDAEPVVFKGLHIGETYILKEVNAPEGYFVAEQVEFTVKETPEVQTITMLDELIPEIKTKAMFEDETKVNKPGEEMTVIDTVTYKDLVVGKEYTLKGKLLDTKTEEVIASAETSFTPIEPNGDINLDFKFDGSKLLGTTLVVFEDLYRDERHVATHSEITDKEQTVYIPEIKTYASTSNFTEDSVTINDIVKYSDLEVGHEYTLVGWLMDKSNQPLLDKNGERIESFVRFTPTESSGEIEMSFDVSLELLQKGQFVVFEELYLDEKLVSEHKDLNDEKQTVTFTEIIINKIDKDTKEPLKGVEFTLYDTDGNKIKSQKTNELGQVRFLVPVGKYVVVETKALEGYVLSNKKHKFKVNGKELNFEIERTIKNKEIPELPQTGAKSYLITAGIVLVGFGLSFYMLAKIEEMENEEDFK